MAPQSWYLRQAQSSMPKMTNCCLLLGPHGTSNHLPPDGIITDWNGEALQHTGGWQSASYVSNTTDDEGQAVGSAGRDLKVKSSQPATARPSPETVLARLRP